MTEPRWPDDLLARRFAPRRNPLPAPTTEIFDEPRACAKLNFKWFSHVLGALETLTQPDAWAGDDTDVFTAQQQIEQLIEQLSSECVPSLEDVFGDTVPTWAEVAAQFLADYGSVPVPSLTVTTTQLLTEVVLYENTISGAAANWDVSSISQSYDDLELTIIGRGSTSANEVTATLSYNNDTTNGNYQRIHSFGGSSPGNSAGTADRVFLALPAATATANRFAIVKIRIPGYISTARHKVAYTSGGYAALTTSQYSEQYSHLWKSTAAINRIAIAPTAGSFDIGSYLRIVGIKKTDVVTGVVLNP